MIKYVDHVYDQGHLGSCTANALCAAYGLDLKKEQQTLTTGYKYFNPSRLFLYYNTRDAEGTAYSDSGASIRDTVKVLNHTGVCEEVDWPYDVKKFKEKPPQYAYNDAVGNTVCQYERLLQDVDQFRACLNDNCPFVFGFKVYSSFYQISGDGMMPLPTESEKKDGPQGSHAVTAVGYSDTKKCIIVLNSWGQNWGKYGYFYMPYAFIKDRDMCFDFWKISFACQRGKPRPSDSVKLMDTIQEKSIYSRMQNNFGFGSRNGLYFNSENAETCPNLKSLPNDIYSYGSCSQKVYGGSSLWSTKGIMNVPTHREQYKEDSLAALFNTSRREEKYHGHSWKPKSTYNFRNGTYS